MGDQKVLSSCCGFSRMGPNRELKKRVEAFWKEQQQLRSCPSPPDANLLATSIADFERGIEQLQVQRWEQLAATGLDLVPSGEYSLYDHVLDCAVLFNAIPERYQSLEKVSGVPSTLRTYFAMARGLQENDVDVPALPMKKWFDTNYHFIVPELESNQQFSLGTNKPLNDFLLAKSALKLTTKPVLLGPITFLYLSNVVGAQSREQHMALLPALLPVYAQVVNSLAAAGAEWIQVDEPIFALSFASDEAAAYTGAFKQAAAALQNAATGASAGGRAHVVFGTFFNTIAGNIQIVRDLPEGAGIHVDLVRSPEQLDPVLAELPPKCLLSLGLVDGRNIWLTPLQKCCEVAQKVVEKLGAGRVLVGTSCSLLLVPYSVKGERPRGVGVDGAKVLPWLSFGIEKCEHVVLIAKQLNGTDCSAAIRHNSTLLNDHSVSGIIHNPVVKKRVAEIESRGVPSFFRQSPYRIRSVQQRASLQLPLLPTTTIGSFPQSAQVRAVRAKQKAGKITDAEYWEFIEAETAACIRRQEEWGLDVLVHGEFERNDMVEFFAEHLQGYVVTSNGWVQSYGSRCVKPAVLYGDIQRKGPMTVDMIKYAQSLTIRPVKGMLTGPTTILKWSFVRNDQPWRDTLFQVALALRDEVSDLESAGIKCIQMDEPAFREALPLDASQHKAYLDEAVQAFKISTGSVQDGTQIYSHMCYSDFGDIFTHIAELDADVLCIECSRSELSLLACFDRFGYPLMVGPGLYDIHSPRVPSLEELKQRLLEMVKYIPPARLFANPDCGLKTRDWPETEAALRAMVEAAKAVRKQLASEGADE